MQKLVQHPKDPTLEAVMKSPSRDACSRTSRAVASKKGCIHRQDKSVPSPKRCPLPEELEGTHCMGTDQAEVENGQLGSVGGTQQLHRLCGNCFFPSVPEKVERW